MINLSKIVFMAVLFVGVSPAGASVPSQNDFSTKLNPDDLINEFTCSSGGCERKDVLRGQEGGGIVYDIDKFYEDLGGLSPEEIERRIKNDLASMLAKLESLESLEDLNNSDNPRDPLEGQEAGGQKADADDDVITMAGFCHAGNCIDKTAGQEGGGGGPHAPGELITEGPYKGYRMIPTKIIGGHDSRELVEPFDPTGSSSVGMVYCSKKVMIDGKEQTIEHATTGTLVGNRKTVLASAHSLFTQNKNGKKIHDFNYTKDCEYRKYREDGKYYGYNFTYAKTGDYKGSGTHWSGDWAVFKLDKKAYNQRAMEISVLNTSALKDNSTVPIEVIAHQHDRGEDSELFLSEGILRTTTLNGERVYAHTADTNGRASGAAMVYTRKDGSKVIFGIHVAELLKQDLNMFIPINSEILDAIRFVKDRADVSI